MGLPAFDSYPMPERTALPRSHVSWGIDPARAALLVLDMQNHFVDAFPAGRSPVVELVDNITALRELAATPRMPVVFSAEPAGQAPGQRGLVGDMWGPGIGDEPDATAVVAPLMPPATTCWRACGTTHTLALRRAARSGMVCATDGLLRDLLLHWEPKNA
ncbi:hypothetical protein ACWEF9_27990 [Streptomyces sp. NPDC004980]